MNENLNSLINIKKYKTEYLSELAEFEKRISQNINEIDTNLNDLTIFPEEKHLELIINKVETKENNLIETIKSISFDQKKQALENKSNNKLNIIQESLENLDKIRKEPLNLAFLLKDIELPGKNEKILDINLKSFTTKINKLKRKEINSLEKPIEKILENEQKLSKSLDPQIINSNLLNKSNLLFHFSIYHGLFGSKTQEIILNEDQNLSELADNIYCLVKEFRSQDQNDNISNSSFFFIENVFYNDMRKIESKILSKSIVFKQKRIENEEKVKIFEENLMETQKIKDLSLRIGKIYLYRHHESCDHMIVVNSIRFVAEKDPKLRISYPFNIFTAKTKRKKCGVCQNFFAKIICFNDKICNKQLLFLCENCYKDIHYDENDSLKYRDFQIYPYLHE